MENSAPVNHLVTSSFILILLISISCGDEQVSDELSFDEFTWGLNMSNSLLCTDAPITSVDTNDIIFLDCQVEGDNFSSAIPEAKNELILFTYNIEKGHHAQEIIDLLAAESELVLPDVFILSEVDRNCSGSFEGKNFARELAEEFGMYYVYGTEFYEVNGDCEHGNAIVSRYPIGNVDYVRFDSASTYYMYDESINYRQGGRMFLSGDIKIGDKFVRIYSTHLAAYFFDESIRDGQARQLASHASQFEQPVVLAGDFNSYGYTLYLLTGAGTRGMAQHFFDIGLSDTHAGLTFEERVTNFDLLDLVIDLFFVKGLTSKDPKVGNDGPWEGLSDHYPSWVTVEL